MLVILDLEEVLLGTEARRRAAVAAAGHYLEHVCRILDGARLATWPQAEALVAMGGFEDPVALAAGLTLRLLSSLGPSLRPRPGRPTSVAGVQRDFRDLNLRFVELLAFSESDMSPLVRRAQERGGGYAGLLAALGHDTIDGHILRRGEVRPPGQDGENVMARLVDGMYLGNARFEALHGFAPGFDAGAGWIEGERATVAPEALGRLAELATLACVTERRQIEVTTLLERAGLSGHLAAVVCAPGWPLEEALEALARESGGDLPPDQVYVLSHHGARLERACAAGLQAVGFARRRDEHRLLQAAGARAVVQRLDTLTRVLTRRAGVNE